MAIIKTSSLPSKGIYYDFTEIEVLPAEPQILPDIKPIIKPEPSPWVFPAPKVDPTPKGNLF